MRPFLLILAASGTSIAQIIAGYAPPLEPRAAVAEPHPAWPWELRGRAVASGTVASSIVYASPAATSSAPTYSATSVSTNSGNKGDVPVEKAAAMLAVVAGVAALL